MGPPDIHVKAGSSVTITCVISQGPHDLGTVYWYKGDHILENPPENENEADLDARISIQVISFSFHNLTNP